MTVACAQLAPAFEHSHPRSAGVQTGKTISCSGIAMHSVWSALKKRNYLYLCIESPVCLLSYIRYHIVGVSLPLIFIRALTRRFSASWGSRIAE
jgi:hypothetical protein